MILLINEITGEDALIGIIFFPGILKKFLLPIFVEYLILDLLGSVFFVMMAAFIITDVRILVVQEKGLLFPLPFRLKFMCLL